MAVPERKEGVKVKEIEDFAKKHRFEVFFCLAFILSGFFSFVFFGTGWTLLIGCIGGVLGALVPQHVGRIMMKLGSFVFKQEQTTQLVLGIVGLILAIFLPPLTLLLLGMQGGKAFVEQFSRSA